MTDIWIAGLGVRAVDQVTREVERALRASRRVLYLDGGVATRPYLESLCPRVTSLFERSYAVDRPRLIAYEHMAISVIQAALEAPPVTFAIHGHPLVAVHAPFLVLEMAKALELRVEILPGISSLDALFADLRLDPVVHGVQMYEATDLLLRRRPLQNDVPAVIWQIGPLETALHSSRVSRPERFTRFIAHLRKFYPAQHETVAIYCAPHPLMPPAILRFALDRMGEHAEELHAGFTLYVPPAMGRPVQDGDLLAGVYSLDHLQSITPGEFVNVSGVRVKLYRFSYACHRLVWRLRWWTWYFFLLAVFEILELNRSFAGLPPPFAHYLTPANPSAVARLHLVLLIELAWVVVFILLAIVSSSFDVRLRYVTWWAVRYRGLLLGLLVAAVLVAVRRPLQMRLWAALEQFLILGTFLKVAAVALIVLFLYGVYRARGRLVILPFTNYTGDDTLKCCVEGLAPLLLNDLARLAKLYTTVDETAVIEALGRGSDKVLPGPWGTSPGTEKSGQGLDKGLPATVSVEDVGDVLQSTVSAQSQIKFWGIEIPLGALLRIAGRLARSPRLSGSLHKEGKRLVLIATIDRGRHGQASWRVGLEELPEAADCADTVLVGKMMDQLAYRVFADLVPSISQRWQAVRRYAEGLNFLRITTRTKKDREANLRQAERAFLQALGEDNKFARNHYNLGVVYSALGAYDAARAAFYQAVKEDSNLIPAYYALAFDAWNRGDYHDAISYCDQVIALQPGVAQAWDLKGLAQRKIQEQRFGSLRAGQHLEAWRESLESREIAAALAWRALCGAALRGRSLAEPWEVARKCVRGVALAHAMMLRFGRGISMMEQALYLAPADADLHFEMGKILTDPTLRAKGTRAFALKFLPERYRATQQAKLWRSRLRLGMNHFRAATRVEPRRALYRAYLAESLAELFQALPDQAIRQGAQSTCDLAMDYASGDDWETGESRDRVVAALKAIGNTQEADAVAGIPKFLQQLEAQPNEDPQTYRQRLAAWEQKPGGQGTPLDPWMHGQIAVKLARELLPADPVQAQQLTERAIQSLQAQHPGEIREQGLHGLLAQAYRNQGKPELRPKALLHAQQAVAINPERPWERSILADIYWALGEYQSAEAEWNTCLDLSPESGSWAGIASAYWQQGVFLRDPQERKKAFRSVIEFYGRALRIVECTNLTPQNQNDQIRDHGSIHYWMGRFHQELLDFDLAVAHMQAARNMGYKPLESAVYLGWVHAEVKNYDAAEASFREAVSRVRDQQKQGKQLKDVDSGLGEELSMNELLVMTYLMWSYSYSDRGGLLVKAEQLALRSSWLVQQLDAVKAQNYEATRLDCLGYARLRMGRVTDAVNALESSLALNVDAGACARLAEAYCMRAAANKNLRDASIAKARHWCMRARTADLRQQYVQAVKDLEDRLNALA